jgi:hypothetical protein
LTNRSRIAAECSFGGTPEYSWRSDGSFVAAWHPAHRI